MKLSDALELLLLAALWGGSFLFMRVAAPVLGPVWLIALRVGLTSLVLLPLVLKLNLWREIRAHWLPMMVVGGLGSALPFLMYAYASLSLPAGFTSILNATTPLFGAVVAAIWLKERLTPIQFAGLLLGFAGVVVLVGWRTGAGLSFWLSVAAGLGAAVCYAIASPYAAKTLVGVRPLAIAAGSQMAATLWLIPMMPFAVPHEPVSLAVAASVFGLAGLSTALAYVLYFRLLQSIGSTKVLTVTYLIPGFAILWGALLLGEAVTVAMIGGGLLVLLSVAIANGIVSRGFIKSFAGGIFAKRRG